MLKIVSEKPPIGLRPRFIYEEHRIEEIEEAMGRYRDAGKTVPKEWTEEHNELKTRLEWQSSHGMGVSQYEMTGTPEETQTLEVRSKRTGGLLRSDCELKADKVIEKARELFNLERDLERNQKELRSVGGAVFNSRWQMESQERFRKKIKKIENDMIEIESEVYDLIVDVVNCEKKGG